jgi:RNA polymerase sigma factor (sigma-70 family)
VHRSEPERGGDPTRVAALVRAAQTGDRMAVDGLLDLLTPHVRRWCGPIALDEGADATQEALIVIFRNLRQLRIPEALFGWVRTIAVREAVRIARRRGTHAELTDLPAAGDPQLITDVADVLSRLSPEHRAILLLREVEGIGEHEAAALLGVPLGTAKSRLSRARRSFRKEWRA